MKGAIVSILLIACSALAAPAPGVADAVGGAGVLMANVMTDLNPLTPVPGQESISELSGNMAKAVVSKAVDMPNKGIQAFGRIAMGMPGILSNLNPFDMFKQMTSSMSAVNPFAAMGALATIPMQAASSFGQMFNPMTALNGLPNSMSGMSGMANGMGGMNGLTNSLSSMTGTASGLANGIPNSLSSMTNGMNGMSNGMNGMANNFAGMAQSNVAKSMAFIPANSQTTVTTTQTSSNMKSKEQICEEALGTLKQSLLTCQLTLPLYLQGLDVGRSNGCYSDYRYNMLCQEGQQSAPKCS